MIQETDPDEKTDEAVARIVSMDYNAPSLQNNDSDIYYLIKGVLPDNDNLSENFSVKYFLVKNPGQYDGAASIESVIEENNLKSLVDKCKVSGNDLSSGGKKPYVLTTISRPYVTPEKNEFSPLSAEEMSFFIGLFRSSYNKN